MVVPSKSLIEGDPEALCVIGNVMDSKSIMVSVFSREMDSRGF